MKTVKEVLTEALAAIEERGWTKGDYVDDKGCLCSLGAVYLVVNGDPQDDRYFNSDLAKGALDLLQSSSGHFSVHKYNDDSETTLDDVRAMFRKAIENAA